MRCFLLTFLIPRVNPSTIKQLAFIEGACVMLLELSIPHVIAPVLGNSINVWSTMIMMSVGDWRLDISWEPKLFQVKNQNNLFILFLGLIFLFCPYVYY